MGIAVRLSIAIGRDDGDANEYANTGDEGVVVEEAAAVFCFWGIGQWASQLGKRLLTLSIIIIMIR